MKLSAKAKKLLAAQCFCILQSADKHGSGGRWPMPVLKSTNDASIFSEPAVAVNFYRRVRKLLAARGSYRELSKIFPYPSPLARLTMIFRSRRIWRLDKRQQVGVMNMLSEILYGLYQADHFCRRGSNILWTREEQAARIAKLQPAEKNKIPLALVSQLDGRLWLYTETLYSRWHNLGHEFHGPYQVRGRENLLVKEWHDLQGLGEKIFSGFPYKKITCYEFYKNNKLSLDIHNRLKSAKPLASTMTRAYIEIDGRPASIKAVSRAIKTLDVYLDAGAQYLSRQNAARLKQINAMMEFYAIKPLADALGEDWRPAPDLLKAIRRGKLSSKAKKVLARLSYYYPRFNKRNVKIQWDPSVNFK